MTEEINELNQLNEVNANDFKRVYSVGNRPQSPIILDVVYLISDIREELPTNQNSSGDAEQLDDLPCWSYVIDEVIPVSEYLRRSAEHIADTIREMDGALFELDAAIADTVNTNAANANAANANAVNEGVA